MTHHLLETALEAAHRAGEILMARLWGELDVTQKGYRDVVTAADTAAESAILSLIRERFPTHAILAEESGAIDGDAPTVWVVDPLDGTTNYARGHPTFSVSVAVLERGVTLAGVVHDPVRGHTFAACRGAGATLNGRAIAASPADRLADAIVALDWGHADADRQRALHHLNRLAGECRTIRTLGSAALALAYVGAGWLDVYFALGIKPWDAAAASLIVTEAGGTVTTLEGEPWSIEDAAILATNGRLHPAIC
ncbi:MAG: inositol monophosphatase [Anaerolineae bacterium]|nr:inositol monophosphatase [Anaerolineae bacterium]